MSQGLEIISMSSSTLTSAIDRALDPFASQSLEVTFTYTVCATEAGQRTSIMERSAIIVKNGMRECCLERRVR